MNKKGFTLIEIIVSISLISVVVIFLFQMIITIKNLNDSEVNKTNNEMTVAIITREVEKDLNSFGLEKEPEKGCKPEDNKNIIPTTAENIKCIKLTYRSINVKNNEGYIIYYKNKNNNKSFLAYKRGKGNIIETQTVREISIEPNNELNIEIKSVNSEDNGLSSLKMIVPIGKDAKKYDLVINYVDYNPVDNKRKVIINTTGGELLTKEGEGSYEPGTTVSVKFSYNTNEYLLDDVTCTDYLCDTYTEFSFTMPDNNVEINISLIKNNIANYLKYIRTREINTGLGLDDYNNLRYLGTAKPKNYISFNNEIWRIIGVFNVYTVDSNQNEQLVKIIRNESLGNYVWDTSASSVNSGMGVSDWSQADLMTELNTDYLDTTKTSGTTLWYNGFTNSKNGSYTYSKNIKSEYIDKIASVRWYLGTNSRGYSVSELYNKERTETKTWDGKIALMYPSDYGYASTNSSCRENMFNQSEGNETGACASENWLHDSQNTQLTLATGTDDDCTIYTISNGGVDQSIPSYNVDLSVRPVLYLKSSIKITGGSGTATSPYTID